MLGRDGLIWAELGRPSTGHRLGRGYAQCRAERGLWTCAARESAMRRALAAISRSDGSLGAPAGRGAEPRTCDGRVLTHKVRK